MSEVRAGSSRSELLPCPFCGGEVFMMQHPKGFWTVEHKDVNFECPFHMAFFDTKEEAVERWNRRAEQPTLSNLFGIWKESDHD